MKSILNKIYSILDATSDHIRVFFSNFKLHSEKFCFFLKENWSKLIDLIVSYTLLLFFIVYWRWTSAKSLQQIFWSLSGSALSIMTVLLLACILSNYDILRISGFILNKNAVDFSSVLLTLVGMLGTIMAIIFSLSVLAVQKASDSYSSRYIRNFVWDWKEYSVYSIFMISIVALLYLVFRPDIYSVNILFSAYLSILILAFLLYLIFVQYKTVTKKIDPYYVLKVLEEESVEQIKNIEAYSQQLSAINAFTNDDSKILKSAIFQYNYFPLKSKIKDIYSITMRLSNKGYIEPVNDGLKSIEKILLIFLKRNKNSIFIYRSNDSVFSFDTKQNEFLEDLYEKLSASGLKFMEMNTLDNARTIVDIYCELCVATASIKPALLNNAPVLNSSNPIFNLSRGYFSEFIDMAIAKKNLEIIFKATQVIEPIMKSTIDNHLRVQCSLMIDTVRKILIYGITNSISFLPKYCVDIYLKSIRHIIFSGDKQGKYFMQSFFNEMKVIFALLPSDAQVDFEVGLQTIILEINPDKHGKYAENIFLFFYHLHEFLLDQFRLQKIISNLGLIAELIENTIFAIEKLEDHQSFIDNKVELKELLFDFSELPIAFYGFIKGETLTDYKIGLELTSIIYKPIQRRFENDPQRLRLCTENIVKISNYLFQKEKYDAYRVLPKLALQLVYLGTLAKKLKFVEIADYAVLSLYDFKYKYVENYFSKLPEDKLQNLRQKEELLWWEISGWRDSVRGWKSHDRWMYEDIGLTYGIELEDVDDFLFYAWGYLFDDSHIEELYQRKKLIGKLIRVLQFQSKLY